jgi:hypothetical protein
MGGGKEMVPLKANRYSKEKDPFQGHTVFFITGGEWNCEKDDPFQELNGGNMKLWEKMALLRAPMFSLLKFAFYD